MDTQNTLLITQEQFDLLSNAVRIRIMYALKDHPMTAKQTAEYLGESTGTVHYHIQKLLTGGLLELVGTKEVSGIVEKYYQSKGDRFELDTTTQGIRIAGHTKSRIFGNLVVNEKELQVFMDEVSELLTKWEQRPVSTNGHEIVFDASIIIRNGGDAPER